MACQSQKGSQSQSQPPRSRNDFRGWKFPLESETVSPTPLEILWTFVASLPQAAVVSRLDGTILYCNPVWLHLGRWNPDRVVGNAESSLYGRPEDYRRLRDRFGAGEAVENVEVTVRRGNGDTVSVRVTMRSLPLDPEPLVLSIFTDTDTVPEPRTPGRTRTLESHQAAVARFGQIALTLPDPDTLIEASVAQVTQTLNVDRCMVLELLPNRQVFLLRSGVGWQPGLVGSAQISAGPTSQAGYTLRRAEAVKVRDLRVETRFPGTPLLHNHGIVSGLSVVIPGPPGDPSSPWGVLSVHTRSPRDFTADEVHFLEAIAHILGTAIERHRADERLRLMERAIDASRNGIIITDATAPDNPVILANTGFERMTGYSKQEVIGQNCRFLQGDQSDPETIARLREAIEAGRECHIEVKNYRRDGSAFWNELSISPVYNSQGFLTHFIGIQTDISDRKQSEAALVSKSAALAKFSDQLKQLHRLTTRLYPSLEARFQDYLQTGCELLQMPVGLIASADGETYTLQFIHAEKNILKPGQTLPPEETFCMEPIRAQTTILQLQAGGNSRRKPQQADGCFQLESYIGTPIWVGDRIYGVLSFASPQPRTTPFQPPDREIVELMAQGLGNFLAAQEIERQRRRTEKALRESEERYRMLVELCPDTIAIHCDRRLVYINPAGVELLGAQSSQELIGRSIYDFAHPDYIRAIVKRLKRMELDGRPAHLMEQQLIRLDGQIVDVEIAGIPTRYDGHEAVQIIIRDISDRKKAEAQLLRAAYYDTLTQLPNRSLFNQKLAEALQKSKQDPDYQFAVLFLDLDRFKVVNDSLGHLVGDSLLVEIAHRLEACVGASHSIARLGGDEFTILLDGISSPRKAMEWAEKIHGELTMPFYIEGHEIFTTASIGIVPSRGPATEAGESPKDYHCLLYNNPEDFLRDADIAMYHAKEQGKARSEVFDLSMHTQTLALLQLETDLRQAVFGSRKPSEMPDPMANSDSATVALAADGVTANRSALPAFSPQLPALSDFVIHYQPIVSLLTGRIVGFEALVRWMHPRRGLVSPVEFIPVAEETGLIVPLGAWVLEEACHQLASWQDQLKSWNWERYSASSDLTVSVNLSGKQLNQPNLIAEIDEILAKTGCDPKSLKLEITESILVENFRTSLIALAQLKARNIHLAIDDFGTGYSSLSYLHQFPLKSLKIDRSFVSRLDEKSSAYVGEYNQPQQIIKAIVSLAHNLGLEVTAEGIETRKQMQFLHHLRCDYGQGYLFAKPLPPEEATQLLLNSAIAHNLKNN
ncbi:EAL domain-containing protein [Lyngbya sp. CCY1209]|uniref:EAL domain-containing protein n=1 Tax=Lyngbya sp. CCY1209 TaxID=2886103 RepID=UPI0035C8B225